MIGPEDERPHQAADGAGGDAVAFAWGDVQRGLFGSARLGRSAAGASALGLLFAGGDPVAVGLEGGLDVPGGDGAETTIGDLASSVVEPLRAWRVTFDGDGGGFELDFSALSGPLELGAAAARAAGLEGYEQPCRVTGTVRAGDRTHEVDCLGQRGHQWGDPDWERVRLSRTLSAWFGEDKAVCLAAVRTSEAMAHAGEAVSAHLLTPGETGPRAILVGDPRLSTVYDEEGRQRRAGLELWPEPDARYPRRAAGEAVCGTSLDLGRLRLDTAFFEWRMEGTQGVGRYDVLRRHDG